MERQNEDNLIGKTFFKHYKLRKKIGEGSFGNIYMASNIDSKEKEKYAVKLESKDLSRSLLEIEAYVLNKIKAFGIPELKIYGYNSDYNILMMELLGSSLEKLFQSQNKSFSLKTACMLGIQMIDRLEYLHYRKLIHRDIKPDNFVIGRGAKSHIVYILDFGLAKKYWSSTHQCHIPFKTGKKLTGTPKYASINTLSGYEQSRRDDLESVGYILIYFLRGSLPWEGLKANNKKDRYKKICDKKKSISAKDLCRGFPVEFENFVSYTRNLEFTQVPDYSYLRNLLKRVIEKNGDTIDFFYDWCSKKPKIKSDDIIYTNNYKIKYNGPNEWLNNFEPYKKSLNISSEDDSIDDDSDDDDSDDDDSIDDDSINDDSNDDDSIDNNSYDVDNESLL